MSARVLFATAMLSVLAPAVASGQWSGIRFGVQGALGSQIRGGGENQSLSVAVSSGERIQFLISGERIHLPTEVTRFEDGYSVTRHGTTRFISAELRWAPFTFSRVSPYVLAGVGRGTSHPNVNEHFPDPVSNDAALFFAGGGIRVPVTERFSVVADMRFLLQAEGTNDGSVFLFLPVRAGLAWRF